MGSNQRVSVKIKFQKKAKKTYELCRDAIAAGENTSANKKWKDIFGRPFPASTQTEARAALKSHRDTEQFIEDLYPLDIRFNLKLECEVLQDGFRVNLLRTMLSQKLRLSPKKQLKFYVNEIDVPGEFILKWKVLNRGTAAEQRDCIRGNIVSDNGFRNKQEKTDFSGEHIVECYAIKNGVVVAKDRIRVPIQ